MFSRVRIVILILIVLLPLTASGGSFEGRRAYRTGEYDAALHEFGTGEQEGPVGTFFLALMHLRGEGVTRDEVRGLVLLHSSAENGYFAAQYLLGQRYFYGRGVPRDKIQATSYLLAASQEDYRAVVLLKIMEKGSRGEKKDQENIVAAVKRKARSNDSTAQYTLGFMYLIGDGVPKDAAEELRWYRAAASRNARAAFMLSLMHHYGEGVPRNQPEAARFMRIAAEHEDYRAQYYLGTFCHAGIGVPVDRAAAAHWFKRSAETGYPEAQLAYGMLLLSGDGAPVDKAEAITWLTKAANQHNARASEVVRELLTYRGLSVTSPLYDPIKMTQNPEKAQNENQLRLEGKGVLLDQGTFGLKFSLPTLYDAYAPRNLTSASPLWDRLQGGVLDIIIRPPQ